MKTISEIFSETYQLGFEDSSSFDENKAFLVSSYNEAQMYIARYISPILKCSTFTKEKSGEYKFNLNELLPNYCQLFGPILLDGSAISDYRIDVEQTLILPEDIVGEISISYEKYPEVITEATDTTTFCELSNDAVILMPYRMAYRIWLDDDERKASMYQNELISIAQNLIPKKIRHIATVETDGGCI